MIREFREIKEFRDVRAMPATNPPSFVMPLNRETPFIGRSNLRNLHLFDTFSLIN